MKFERIRTARGILAPLALLLLAACLLTPGKFVSELDIRKDGRFSFTYVGEIHLLALSKLAEMGAAAENTFTPRPCHADDGAIRKCSEREIADQKSEWEENRRTRGDKRQRDAESMKQFLGGIDPASPRAAEELAQRLRRQTGWKKVEYRGDGLFDVDFAMSGRLDRDFAFPTIERFPMANAFVQLSVRSDGTVRIDAPGFGPAAAGDPWRQMMGASAASGAKADGPRFPVIDGRFTLRTDAAVLANNTDEGPQTDPAGHKLEWAVTPRSPATPMALVRLQR